ncbi:MAG TPA: EamA family transporter RarD [Marinobacter hydrocarbonoclasticus]|uniref:Chloramphenicol-sensitive protein RarD n=1 Tax=Marinobacter nauticus TaxID=2743 RepID=A0A368XV49_MARNT|nr:MULTISPECIES: EamA family transporter RarD [Marinobacter]ERS82166.1 membrane protein [Marinobacter sp. C1S70]RCW69904.1 chloramphenicol-sensitive protein RarD [Marinobacter nauticus]HAX10176.1 EamA family transporter RarD [Marinobacter nauticus]|tara:strand:- start:4787 stop:5683 length:897 start_codon:yes stop_codon:yes gene_type:complete
MKPLNDTTKGVVYGLGAYTLWGSFPLYFALFKGIPSWEVLIHRVIWSCLFLAVVISILKRWPPVVAALRKPRRLGYVLGCAVFIALNWGIYIYAVETRHVLQASLGYFLTPLVNVAMGLLILGERISRLQAAAVGLAAVAILYQLFLLGELPWITLVLAFSFGTYGLMRKKVELDGLSGLFVETLLLLPLGLLTLAWLSSQGLSHFSDSTYSALLLASSGAVTAIPLLAFAGAARRLKLSTVGFLMYINPTIQFLIALYIFHEPLSTAKLVSFVMIWGALAIYSWSAWVGRSNREVSA